MQYWGMRVDQWKKLEPHDVALWGQELASRLQAGTPLLLQGPVGVGKSTIARAILSVFRPDIATFPSPSFPLMIPYETPEGLVCHFDLYRLTDVSQLDSLNLQAYGHQARCLIEWPDMIPVDRWPSYHTLHLRFHPHESSSRMGLWCQKPCSIVHDTADMRH